MIYSIEKRPSNPAFIKNSNKILEKRFVTAEVIHKTFSSVNQSTLNVY